MTHPLSRYPFPKSQLDFWLGLADEPTSVRNEAVAAPVTIPHLFYSEGVYKHPYAAEAWNERTYELLAGRVLSGDSFEIGDLSQYAALGPNGVLSAVNEATQMMPPASFVIRLALTRQRQRAVTVEEAEEVTKDADAFISTLWLEGKPRANFTPRSQVVSDDESLVALVTVDGFTEEGWGKIFDWVSEDNDWDVMSEERKALASNPNLPSFLTERFRRMLNDSFQDMGDDEFADDLNYSAYNLLSYLRTMTPAEAEEEGRILLEAFRPRFKDGKIDDFGSNTFIKDTLAQLAMNPALSPEFGVELARTLAQRCLYVPFADIIPVWNIHPVTYAAWSVTTHGGKGGSDVLFSEEESIWLTDEQAQKLSKVWHKNRVLWGRDQYEDAPSRQVWCRPGYPCAVSSGYLSVVEEVLADENPLSLLNARQVEGRNVPLPPTHTVVDAVLACACGTTGVEEVRSRVASTLAKILCSEGSSTSSPASNLAASWLPYLGKCLADLEEQFGKETAENIPLGWLVELV